LASFTMVTATVLLLPAHAAEARMAPEQRAALFAAAYLIP
jgi:hypothetical protein